MRCSSSTGWASTTRRRRWSPGPSRARPWHDALGRRRAVLLRNHGVVIAGEDVALGGAHGGHPGTRHPLPDRSPAPSGRLRPIPAGLRGADGRRRSTRTGSSTSTGRPGSRKRPRALGQEPRALPDARRAAPQRRGGCQRRSQPQELLLDVLRERLGLTGPSARATSRSAAPAPCSSTALPVSSCTYLAAEADGRDVADHRGPARAAGVRPHRAMPSPARGRPVRLLHSRPWPDHPRPARRRRAPTRRRSGAAWREPVPLHGLRGIVDAAVRSSRG